MLSTLHEALGTDLLGCLCRQFDHGGGDDELSAVLPDL
ncbi:MAG: hypothetical protein ACI82F_004024, partial [Planctomycetota bacterium]